MDYKDWLSRNNIPFYPSESDYTTNSPSYYENLARKTHLIKRLAEKIWEYDEELAKRFLEWDLQIENLDKEVFDMLERWVVDGTMTEVIANTIHYKSNIIVSVDEPENADNQTYWYKDLGIPHLETGNGTIINTNVAVQDDEPDDEKFNVWFDY